MAELRSTGEDRTPIHLHSAAGDLRQSLDPAQRTPPRTAPPPVISDEDLRAVQDAVAELKSLDADMRAQVLDALDPETRAQIDALLDRI